MKNRFTLLSVGMTVLAALSFLGTALWSRARAPVIPAELQAPWSAAIALMEKGDYRSAQSSLGRWIADAKARGIQSSEAHYNLAIAHWEMKEPGASASELLNSLLLSQSLGQIGRAQAAMAGMQRDLGVSDATVRETRFQARVWLTDNGLTFILMAAFWSLIALGFWIWRKRESLRWTDIAAAAALPLALFALAGTGLFFRDWKGGYAILDAQDGTIGLFPDPRLDTQEKLLDLPSGTLVHSNGESQNGFLRIDSPIIAWVQSTELKTFTP